MKGINRIQWCSVVLLAFSLTACKVKRPETVLPDAKMENVLYDYHIAKAMGEEVPYNESYKRVLYIESVFKKYGITQADFDSSMVWFARNPEVLTKIYEKVNVRLKAERITSRRQYRRVDMAAYLSVDGHAPGQQDNVYVAFRHQFPRP